MIKILSIALVAILSFSIFDYAYAVDNNCNNIVIRLVQQQLTNFCFDDRLDALENAPAGSETTDCINMANQYQIIVNSTNGDCFVRALANGTGITLSVNSTHIIINSTSSGSTTCTNLGSVGEALEVDNCQFKKLLAGTGISLSSNGTRITITNTLPEATVCNNVGTGNQLCSGGNVNLDTLIAGDRITITDTTDDWTIASVGIGQMSVLVYQSQTKTNIGNAYVDIYVTNFDMEDLWNNISTNTGFDCANSLQVKIEYIVDYVGTGSQQYRWVDANNNANVLWEDSTIIADAFSRSSDWITKPAWCTSNNTDIEMQGKSTVAGDDPIVRGYTIAVR